MAASELARSEVKLKSTQCHCLREIFYLFLGRHVDSSSESVENGAAADAAAAAVKMGENKIVF
jgi:hypothetical protein